MTKKVLRRLSSTMHAKLIQWLLANQENLNNKTCVAIAAQATTMLDIPVSEVTVRQAIHDYSMKIVAPRMAASLSAKTPDRMRYLAAALRDLYIEVGGIPPKTVVNIAKGLHPIAVEAIPGPV